MSFCLVLKHRRASFWNINLLINNTFNYCHCAISILVKNSFPIVASPWNLWFDVDVRGKQGFLCFCNQISPAGAIFRFKFCSCHKYVKREYLSDQHCSNKFVNCPRFQIWKKMEMEFSVTHVHYFWDCTNNWSLKGKDETLVHFDLAEIFLKICFYILHGRKLF